MSIVISLGPIDLSIDEYLQVGDRLPYAPRGRDYHVCSGQNGALYILEVWDSREAMDAHMERLVPVLHELYGPERFQLDFAIRDVVSTIQRDESFVRP